MPKVIPQKQFDTLDEFIDGCNNYAMLFQIGGEDYRETTPAYDRFKEQNLEFDSKLKQRMNEINIDNPKIPWDKLWDSYKLMSQLVYEDDPFAIKKDGSFDTTHLFF